MGFEDKKPGRGADILAIVGEPKEDEGNDGVSGARAFAKALKGGDFESMFKAFCTMQKAADSEPEEEESEEEGDEPKSEELDFGK